MCSLQLTVLGSTFAGFGGLGVDEEDDEEEEDEEEEEEDEESDAFRSSSEMLEAPRLEPRLHDL